eukprot:1158048-Pelagomonas_calceolata.AAC.3
MRQRRPTQSLDAEQPDLCMFIGDQGWHCQVVYAKVFTQHVACGHAARCQTKLACTESFSRLVSAWTYLALGKDPSPLQPLAMCLFLHTTVSDFGELYEPQECANLYPALACSEVIFSHQAASLQKRKHTHSFLKCTIACCTA